MTTTTTLPPLHGWADFTDALAKRDRLAADLRQAHRDLDALQGGARDAAKADDDAQARAVLDGTRDPGRRATAKHEADSEKADRQVRVLTAAVTTQDTAVLSLLRDQRERAQRAAQDALEIATEGYRQALDGLAEAREAFHAARQAASWVEEGLPSGRRYKRSGAPGLTVPGAVTANGDPMAVGPVLDALAAETGTGPRMIAGPWRGTQVPEGEAVRMVARHRADYTADPTGRTTTTYTLPAHQVAEDDAARQAERRAHERREQERTRGVMRQEAERQSKTARATLPVTADPLADLREDA